MEEGANKGELMDKAKIKLITLKGPLELRLKSLIVNKLASFWFLEVFQIII